MNRRDAWKIVREHCQIDYDGSEYEEMKETIDRFWEARNIVSRHMTRRWWEFWK